MPLATNDFTLQAFLSKGNGTDAIVTVEEDASMKEAGENREFITLGSCAVYQLGIQQLPVTLHYATKGTERDPQRAMGD